MTRLRLRPRTVLPPADEAESNVGFGTVLRNREFRAMYVAHLASVAGDQIAKVALAIVVYDRTSSAALSSLVYALTFLPWIAAPVLSSVGDTRPRRTVLVVCDLARATLVLFMILPGMPLGAMLALLAGVSLLAPPFEATRSALLADVVTGRPYVVATALTQMSLQAGQVVGFAAGGLIVAGLTPSGALTVDAATFGLSAALLLVGVRHRPATASTRVGEPARRWSDGLVYVLGDRTRRSLVLLAWVVVFFAIAPEGLAVAVVSSAGGSDLAVGLLTAAGPLGVLVGTFAVGRRLTPARQVSLMLPLALLATAPLALTSAVAWLPALGALWAMAGAGLAFNLPANAAFVRSVDSSMRSRAFGVAQAGLQISQAAGLLVAGAVADHMRARSVVTIAGIGGALAVTGLWIIWPFGECDESQ